MSIESNLKTCLKNIETAANKSGRPASDIKLVAVTKTIGPDKIKTLTNMGIISLGENKVQELTTKYSLLPTNIDWHFIGNLQTNKVKYLINKVSLIHSVNSLKLAQEINKRAAQSGIVQNVLIEINIADEKTKSGINPEYSLAFSKELSAFGNICLKGLMAIAPNDEKPENNRHFFRKMRKLFLDIQTNISDNRHMQYLSMGMTNDYTIAIEEGANIVRIGTGIFGA